MRLGCNLITNNGRESTFHMAGSYIPDELVPEHAKQYRISEREGRKLKLETQRVAGHRGRAARKKEA